MSDASDLTVLLNDLNGGDPAAREKVIAAAAGRLERNSWTYTTAPGGNAVRSAPTGSATSTALAIREFPQVNGHFDDDAGVLTRHAAVHLGIATQTDAGLMVPVLRQAQTLGLWACSEAIAQLAAKARAGKATREELFAKAGMTPEQIAASIAGAPRAKTKLGPALPNVAPPAPAATGLASRPPRSTATGKISSTPSQGCRTTMSVTFTVPSSISPSAAKVTR